MKNGYDVFGQAYGIMLRNDPHDQHSIDHQFMKEMILLDDTSKEAFYSVIPSPIDMSSHELYAFSQQFRAEDDQTAIRKVIAFTRQIADKFDVPIETMLFGGTEKQILERGTDWCADIARLGAVVLDCIGIPVRILHLVNNKKAYNGHVALEAYYENRWGIVDPLFGYLFYDHKPVSALDIYHAKTYLRVFDPDYAGYFSQIAMNEYDPTAMHNYVISKVNAYTLRLNTTDHQGNWIMGEDRSL